MTASRRRLALLALGALLAAPLVAAPSAQATSTARAGATLFNVLGHDYMAALTITGSDGPDHISITSDGTDVITDDAGILADAGCAQVSATSVKCGDISNGPDQITPTPTVAVDLGAGDDTFQWEAVRDVMTINGGAGNDTILGGTGLNTIHGGPGNDHIDGNSGNEKLYGDDGNDWINGYWGADLVDGGAGNDTLFGGMDNDTIIGGPGIDHITDDYASGYTIDHWFGNDTIYAGDGSADVITCLAGTDTAYLDLHDTLTNAKTCEHITRVAARATAPSRVTASPRSKSAIVSWAASAYAGDYAITSYVAVASPSGRSCVVAAAARSCAVTGLANNVAYKFRVHAVTRAGAGALSALSNAAVPGVVPSAVRGFALTSPASGAVKATWVAPLSPGTSGLVRYEIRVRAYDAGLKVWTPWSGWGVANPPSPLARGFVTADPTFAGVPFQVQVRAANRTGVGPAVLAGVTAKL